jgi:hypothetical protein
MDPKLAVMDDYPASEKSGRNQINNTTAIKSNGQYSLAKTSGL